MSGWIKKELRGGKHYPGGDEESVESTLRELNAEFKTIHGELSQKVLNAPRPPAKELAEAYDVPLAIGLVAYQISQDSLLSSETGCELLRREYLRLKASDYAVPPIESAELNFSIEEGQWIEYLYMKFAREINGLAGIATTIAGMLDSKEIPLEKIVVIVQERDKITRGLIAPILRKWVSQHRKATPLQGALAMVEAMRKSPNQSEKAKSLLASKVEEARAVLEKLKKALQQADFSSWSAREMEPLKRRISHLEDSLSQMNTPLGSMTEIGLAELIAQLIPVKISPPAPVEKGGYLVVTSPSPKYGEIPPLLEDPYDFLERDIRLARRRDDSQEFIRRVVEKVHMALINDKTSPTEAAINMITRMHDRLGDARRPTVEELSPKLELLLKKERSEDPKVAKKTDLKPLYDFLSGYFLETFINPEVEGNNETTKK